MAGYYIVQCGFELSADFSVPSTNSTRKCMEDVVSPCQMSLEGDCAPGCNVELSVSLIGSFQSMDLLMESIFKCFCTRSKVDLDFTVCKTGASLLSSTHCVIEKEAQNSRLVFPC